MATIARDLRGPVYRAELRGSWATAVLFRVPSLPLVWLCTRLGIGPMAVTFAALVVALSLPVQAATMPLGWAVWTVAISGAFFHVLDCTDGTLARVTGRSSRRGGDLDFLIDMAQWGMLYLAIGMLADRTLDTGAFWTAVAAFAAWLRLYARTVRDRLADPTAQAPESSALTLKNFVPRFVSGLSGLLPFLALSGGNLWLAVLFLVVYAALDVGEALLPLLHAAPE